MDPKKRTRREKFNEHMNEVLDSFPIELKMANLSEATVIEKELEQLDQDISYVLHKVRKKIEVQKRGVPCSKKKGKEDPQSLVGNRDC